MTTQHHDDRLVEPDRPRKSIGAEDTFQVDIYERDDARAEITPLVATVWHHCKAKKVRARTVTLKRLCRELADGPRPLGDRVHDLAVDQLALEPWEDVEDPAGAELPVFLACAREIQDLLSRLAELLAHPR